MPRAQSDNPATPDLTQIGATAGAIFGALVGADPFDIRNRTPVLRGIDYFVIALWVAAVLLFLYAAATRTGAHRGPGSETARIKLALGVTLAAGLFTIGALIAVVVPATEDHDNVAMTLTPQEQRAISDLCKITAAPLLGSVRTQTLRDAFVIVGELPQTAGARCDTIRIPSSAILVIQEHP